MKKRDANSKVCILTSGGVESAALTTRALDHYEEIYPVYIREGLRWENAEVYWLRKFLKASKNPRLKKLTILESPMRDVYGAHWGFSGSVPGKESPDEAVYLPGRNLVIFSKAASFSSLRDIHKIEVGTLKSNPFPDATKEFFEKFSSVASLALNFQIQVEAPFRHLKKEEVLSFSKNTRFELTFSCLSPKGKKHCGNCNKCEERRVAFIKAGIVDRVCGGKK